MLKETMLPLRSRELFIYRVINRYLKYNELKIFAPSSECLYEAQDLYCNIYNQAIENEILTEEEMIEWMTDIGEWTIEDEEQLNKILPKHIEYFQKEIYNNFSSKKHINQIAIYLNKAKDEVMRLIEKKNAYSHYTAEGLASFSKIQYIIEHSTQPYNWDKYDIKDVITYYYNSYIDDITMRYLARTNPWSDIWYGAKKNGRLFDQSSVNLSEEQGRLIRWSCLYDSINELQDPPKEEIIHCDDALDGWLIIRKEERDREKNLDEAEQIAGRNSNAQEIFMVADSQERAKEIYNLNDPSSRAIIKNRLDTIQSKGQATDIDFVDVKAKLRIQQTQAETGRK